MGNLDARYTLEGIVEMDKAYFTIDSLKAKRRKKALKETLTLSKSDVDAFAKSVAETKEKYAGYFDAKILEDVQAEGTHKTMPYVDIADLVELLVVEKKLKTPNKKKLKWIRITIGNAKTKIKLSCKKINKKNLQGYLNDFAKKLNKKYFENRVFDELVATNIIRE